MRFLRARVVADEQDAGWRVAFEDVTPEAKAALEALRERLPPAPHRDTGFVIAEILRG